MTGLRKPALHEPAPHESGLRHTTGEAIYVDDMPAPAGMLYGQIFASSVARGRITRLDVSAARQVAGVHAVLTADDIPGTNDIAPVAHDEPLLAEEEVFTVGQSVAFIVADSHAACRAAAAAIEVEYETLEAIHDIRSALAADSFLTEPHRIRRGDVDAALARATLVVEGELESGAQDHFYLETHAALVIPGEDSTFLVHSSTQHPSEVQAKTAEVLGIMRNRVVVKTARMGGGFGGKETQGAHFAALAALGATVTQRPVKVWLNRDQDMTQTGKRHPWYSRYRAGFDADGRIVGLEVFGYSDGGWSADLSLAIMDRYLFHLDNAYYVPALAFEGRVCRTNRPSNTAFRGFGGPQGVAVIETIMSRAADKLDIDEAQLRRRNFYGDAPRDRTPYDQPITDSRMDRIFAELIESSDYADRKSACDSFNAASKWIKRGIGFGPIKFGISFTYSVLNQAGAFVTIYTDGTVQLNHGGTEMGQGLHTKMIAVCAHELGVDPEHIRVMDTATDKVPNTSATAASSGSDLNGQAIAAACATLIARLRPIAAKVLGLPEDQAAEIVFERGSVRGPGGLSASFADVAVAAYESQVSLSSTGYYATPGIRYDREAGKGKPFHYFAYGAAVSEVEVNGLTGEHHIRRADILHDVGNSLVPTIDRGQVEGAFIQGVGWLTREELIWGDRGELKTHSPDTYKIPSIGDAPPDFRVALLDRAPQHDVIHGSKAVGEPPLMLALSVVSALRRAVRGFATDRARDIELCVPCTPESVLRAVESARTPPNERETNQ